MTSPRLKPEQLPDWPRRMSLSLAAAYCGVSPNVFTARVRETAYPKPVRIGGLKVWDRKLLDEALDREVGLAEPSPPPKPETFEDRRRRAELSRAERRNAAPR